MNLYQYLLILRARRKIVIYVLLGTVCLALVLSVVLPKSYSATAAVVLDVRSPEPVAGMMIPAMAMPAYMATQRDIIASDRVAQKAVRLLGLAQNPDLKEDWLRDTKGTGSLEAWLAKRLQKKLDIKPSRESNVIEISFRSSNDPPLVAAVANAFAKAYIETNIELRVEPAKQYADWFKWQGQALREDVERAQARLSEYEKQHGIVASNDRFGVETAKLSELSSQLTLVQAQTADARSKQQSGDASSTLPEVLQNPFILNLKADIAHQEAQLQELGGTLGTNHPQYKRVESSIASLKRQLEAETRHITSSFATARTVGRDKEADLKTAVEAQRKKLLDLNTQSDERAILIRDVEAARRAYDAVAQRFNETRLESQFTQTNVSVLTPATEPTEPSFPKPILNVLVSIFLGTFLGVGVAIVLEMIDQRIRSPENLAEMLQLPVLAVVPSAGKRRRLASPPQPPALPAR